MSVIPRLDRKTYMPLLGRFPELLRDCQFHPSLAL
jgi:hypothetical protein